MVEFPPLKNDLLLRAARGRYFLLDLGKRDIEGIIGEQTERAPVWVMRQAGRYLPEFRKVREDHEFFEICRTPELAREITLQPIRRYSGLLDASIIFSDILVVPQAMGMEVLMTPGPYFPDPLNTPADIAKLSKSVNVDKELKYVFDAITLTRTALNGEVPLIGFCGAPWTLFAYMVEGGGTKTFQKSKTWLFKYPEESKALIMRIADVCVDFLVGQILQIFDSWAGELSPHHFAEFSLPSLQHIANGVRKSFANGETSSVPLILFPKGANESLGSIAATAGYDVLGIDWCIEPEKARELVGSQVALQGNMDPGMLYGGKEAIEKEVQRICAGFKVGEATTGWIANLGHGITPGVDPEDLRWFFECVHKYSDV
ncbi:hypothetical protein EUX98_g438 [Antrodiella citrinella]|uniref:Uroporphyrinogen decarboxylase n=1 Tax=Antrodiella citrinella TaxID=2447956 RepID=A0A4S4N3Y0_9APHY|nr:hypothetical protein EUX98_g438 [Antrodiella citrinella]